MCVLQLRSNFITALGGFFGALCAATTPKWRSQRNFNESKKKAAKISTEKETTIR
jgi:hypothetical protein